MQAINSTVILEAIQPSSAGQSASGIIVDEVKQTPTRGIIISTGKLVSSELHVGDEVVYDASKCQAVENRDDHQLLYFQDCDILAVK